MQRPWVVVAIAALGNPSGGVVATPADAAGHMITISLGET